MTWTGNDWTYDGCADCIVGEPHVCFQFEKRRAAASEGSEGKQR